MSALVELVGVAKRYREGGRERRVFEGLDASFEEGQVSVLVGRSGSGKSTLLNLVSGIDVADSGSVLFAGRDMSRLPERERVLHRRHHIGFVFQFFNLLPTLRVRENLLLPLELVGRERQAARARVAELLARIGMSGRGEDFPDQLSGGEQQRVAVARAIAHQPLLVLADEPTGNLDAETAAEVLDLLVGTCRDAGHTLLMVTHSAEAAARADHLFGIGDGRLTRRAPEDTTAMSHAVHSAPSHA